MFTTHRKLVVLLLGVPLLVACSNPSTSTAGTTIESAMEQASSAVASATSEVATHSSGDNSTATAAATSDPVGPAVEAFLKKHPYALIEEIDREDRGATVEIDAVENDAIVTYRVTESGDVAQHETDRDNDSNDITDVKQATVTAVDAFKQALDQHPDGIVDSVSLDNDGGNLHWQVELDDKNYNDLAEVRIPAK